MLLLIMVLAALPSIGDLLALPSNAQHYSLCQECLRFPAHGSQYDSTTHFKKILVDSNHNNIYVGARNAVFRLNAETLKISNQSDFLDVVPPRSDISNCESTQDLSKGLCHNYIMLLLLDAQGKVFACGTNAMNPKCWRFERSGALQATPPSGIDGFSRCPREPQQSAVGVFASNGYLFTGIRIAMSEPGALYRSYAPERYSTTNGVKTRNSFEVPTSFAGSFTAKDNFVYFLFGEKAVEENSKVPVSRIGRVCQFDSGGKFLFKRQFVTFSKARLVCTVPGIVPFDYNEIQSSFKYVGEDATDVFLYATFDARSLGARSGAVCTYSFKKIESVFKNSKYLEEVEHPDHPGLKSWVSVPPKPNITSAGRHKCDSNLDTKRINGLDLVFGNEHPLLSDVIEPVDKQPLFVKASVGFTKVIVDKVAISSVKNIPVLFIGTDNGTVYKVFSNSENKEPHVVEQFDIFTKQEEVFDMKLYKGALYVSSNSSIVKVPVQQCNKYKTCRSCVSARDPYCGWSGSECVIWGEKQNSDWKQDTAFGNVEKVCPETPPSCVISTVTEKPGGTTILQCRADGVPLPKIAGWTKNSTPIKYNDTADDFKFENGNTADTQRLLIMNFGVRHLGSYQCSVSSKKGRSSCTLSVNGTLPVITSGIQKVGGVSYFYCEAVAIPEASVTIYKVIDGKKVPAYGSRVPLGLDAGTRSYYCLASNAFGSSVGKTINIEDREIKGELRLTSETWRSELQNSSSQLFKLLADKVSHAVGETYSRNAAFIRIKNILFRKGSVVSVMKLEFAARPSDSNEALLKDLQQAVDRGNVSGLEVDSGHVLSEKIKTENPTTSTQAPTPTSTPTPTPVLISSTNQVIDTSQEPTPNPLVEGGIGDTGLFVGAILAAVALTLVPSFALGVICHHRTMRCCQRSPNVESADGRNIRAVKYQKSPTADDDSFRKHPSKRKLLRKHENAKKMQPNGDDSEQEGSDSDGSAAGQMSPRSDSCSEKHSSPERTPMKKINTENGKVLSIC